VVGKMADPYVGEIVGTATLILLGDGVVAGVLLNKSKAQNSGWIVITAGWAFAVLCGVFVANATGSPNADALHDRDLRMAEAAFLETERGVKCVFGEHFGEIRALRPRQAEQLGHEIAREEGGEIGHLTCGGQTHRTSIQGWETMAERAGAAV
jgi:hypothetical protein